MLSNACCSVGVLGAARAGANPASPMSVPIGSVIAANVAAWRLKCTKDLAWPISP
jgi:hypothetical protein